MSDASSLLAGISDRIAQAARLARRQPDAVTLVAISKTQPAEAIEPLILAGQRTFGENRVQEAEAKWPALREGHSGLSLHLVGQLQSNKAEDAVRLFDCIHSVDRPSLVSALARARRRRGATALKARAASRRATATGQRRSQAWRRRFLSCRANGKR